MFKTIALYTISFLLVGSILAPAVVVLVDGNNKTSLVIDFGEEEQEQKEGKKKIEENNLLFFKQNLKLSFLSKEKASNISLLQLPPPEQFV